MSAVTWHSAEDENPRKKEIEIHLRLNLEHLECIYGDLGMYNTMTGDCDRPGHDCGSKKLKRGIADILTQQGFPPHWQSQPGEAND